MTTASDDFMIGNVRLLVAAITGLLECAELNQDDLEGDTRYLIENAQAAMGKAGGA